MLADCVLSSVATIAVVDAFLLFVVVTAPARLLFCTLPIPEATFTPTLPDTPDSEPSPIDAFRLKLLIVALPADDCELKICSLPNTLPTSTEASDVSLLCALLTPSAMLMPRLPDTPLAAFAPVVAVSVPAACVLVYCVTEPVVVSLVV